MNKQVTLIWLLLSFFIVGTLQADNIRGRIVKSQGQVFIVNDNNEKRSPEKSKFLINENETVITEADSKAVIQFTDGALSVLSEKSVLRVEKAGWLSQLSGKAYYIFKKVFKKQPQKVHTKFATIGIRGTTFIVNVDGNNDMIALQEGDLNIESPDESYAIRKLNKAADFSDFKNEQQRQFDMMDQAYADYKKRISKEFLEYKKSFDLEANYQVSFRGRQVEKAVIRNDIKREFNDFSSFASDYISAYKELDNLD